MTYPIEEPSTGFSHRPSTCQPGCVRIQAYTTALFGLSNVGCFNPNSVLQPSGNPSFHVYGKAIDNGCNWNDPKQRPKGDAYFAWLIDNRESLHLQQAIWGHQIWDIHDGLQTYHHDDHETHIHASIGFGPSQDWQPPEETDMTPAQEAKLDAVLAAVRPKPDSPSLWDMVNWACSWLKIGGYAKRADGQPSRLETVVAQVKAIKTKVGA